MEHVQSAKAAKFEKPLPIWRQQQTNSAEREMLLSRMLMSYAAAGMVFMLLPGTFLGVWNLMFISSRHAPGSMPAGWIQAHGHAQVFGWIGTFILGIGFYSIPKLRKAAPTPMIMPWICLALWILGVATRWAVGAYEWNWRLLLPVSAVLELAAFLIFFVSVSGHRPQTHGREPEDASAGKRAKSKPDISQHAWIVAVIAGSIGLLAALVLNLIECSDLALRGASPAFPSQFDAGFLALCTWGFLVPFVWGFTSKWMPAFLGLKPSHPWLLITALALDSIGVAASLAGKAQAAGSLLLAGAGLALVALRLFEPTQHSPKTRGVSRGFPSFVRLAFIWSVLAGILGVWGSLAPQSLGVAGASRHALTVGFIATMVFCVGPRILPSFAGMRVLFSAGLMSATLVLLSAGCAVRVSSEIVAYQGYGQWGWDLLPVSAIIEMTAVTLFAINMAITFLRGPVVQPITASAQGK